MRRSTRSKVIPDLVTIGETCAVLVAKTGGPLRYSSEFERRPGGAESTVAVGVARLGHSAGWMSKVGDDEFGEYILNVMRGENVDVSSVRKSAEAQTGVFFRENRASGPSSVYYYRKHSAFSTYGPDDLDEDYIASARILHLTGITPGLSATCRAAVDRAVDIAKANNVTVVVDPNYRAKVWGAEEARECLEPLMLRADHVLAGQEDLAKLTGVTCEKKLLGYLHGLGLPQVILKLGREGAILSGDNTIERVASYLTDRPVDRFGVGDSFAAGFLVGLLEELPVREAVSLGNAVAGWSIRLPGNIEALPDWDDLHQFRSESNFVVR
ncbi:sugar kinase [Martelella mediterranea]|uniref:sugar kinase n=1 Tax=Martelella mediterranea TaxID=293089 RepID=UPI001E588A60|nr:sugar kinase [Martelella mediterranea]MCD1636458.1 sugar kinase [Martelella mediterranea]